MRLDLLRKDSTQDSTTTLNVVVISGSCCLPGMKPFDDQALLIVEQAIAETGLPAKVNVMPATTAMFGGVSKKIMAELMTMFNSPGKIGVPAVLIGGEVVSYGVPTLELMEDALRKYSVEATK